MDTVFFAPGGIRLDGKSGVSRAARCRCGILKNGPFCDGSRARIGFRA